MFAETTLQRTLEVLQTFVRNTTSYLEARGLRSPVPSFHYLMSRTIPSMILFTKIHDHMQADYEGGEFHRVFEPVSTNSCSIG